MQTGNYSHASPQPSHKQSEHFQLQNQFTHNSAIVDDRNGRAGQESTTHKTKERIRRHERRRQTEAVVEPALVGDDFS